VGLVPERVPGPVPVLVLVLARLRAGLFSDLQIRLVGVLNQELELELAQGQELALELARGQEPQQPVPDHT
jgi:hypothetical protein